MTKKIQPGTMFLVPLECGTYAYGYVVFKEEFVWVNIFSFESEADNDFDAASQCTTLLMRDLMTDFMMFTKSKRVNFAPWKLNQKKIIDTPIPPEHQFYIIGAPETPKVVSIHSNITESRPALEEDLRIFQQHQIYSGRYYTLLIEAKLHGKKLELVNKGGKKQYVVR